MLTVIAMIPRHASPLARDHRAGQSRLGRSIAQNQQPDNRIIHRVVSWNTYWRIQGALSTSP